MRKSKSARPSCSCVFDSVMVFLLCLSGRGWSQRFRCLLPMEAYLTYNTIACGWLFQKGHILQNGTCHLKEQLCLEEISHPTSICPLLLIVPHRHQSISNCVSNSGALFSMVASQEGRGSHRREH